MRQSTSAAPAIDVETIVGNGSFTYRIIDDFVKLPPGIVMKSVPAVAVDKHDNLYVFVRQESDPVIVFDRNGAFLGSWGKGQFVNPHGLHIGRDDCIYCTDDGNHTVRKYTLEGKLLLTIGVPGAPSPEFSGLPLNRCTHTALSPENDIYVSDGYRNARVHKYSQQGQLLNSWGESGVEPGEFNVPHNICCDDAGWVYVADRENHRIQVFDGNGKFTAQWHDLHRPCCIAESSRDGLCYIGEMGADLFTKIDGKPIGGNNKFAPNIGHRLVITTKDGKIVGRLRAPAAAAPAKHFLVPHGIAVDSRGDIYIADLQRTWPMYFPNIPQEPFGLGTVKKVVKISERPN